MSKKHSPSAGAFCIIKKEVRGMEMWQENHREEIVMVDMEQLVPKDHLLRKVEKIMD